MKNQILLNLYFLGAGDDENALVDNEEAQAEEVIKNSVLLLPCQLI
jgi:hypothetical protein